MSNERKSFTEVPDPKDRRRFRSTIICAAVSQLAHRWRIVGEKSLFAVVIVKWTETDTQT